MESMVLEHQNVILSQKEIIQSLSLRLSNTEKEVIRSKKQIKSLQHGLAISNLRGNTTIFHMQSFLGHKAAITCMTWLGDLLLTGSTDKSFCVWDQSTDGIWSKIQTIRGHTAGLCLIQFTSKKCGLVITASGDLTVKLWDPRLSWRCVGTLESHDKSVVSSACYITVPINLLVTGDRYGFMCVHDEKGGFTLVFKKNTKYGGILCMELIHEKSKFLATGHNSGIMIIWEVKNRDSIELLEMKKIEVNSKSLPVHQIKMWRHLMVSVGGSKEVKFWDTSNWKCVATGCGHTKSIYDICTTSASTCINGVPQEELEKINEEGMVIEKFDGGGGNKVEMGNEGENIVVNDEEKKRNSTIASILATVGADGQIIFWDPISMINHQQEKRNTEPMMFVKNVKIPRKKDVKPQIITCGAFSPDSSVLVLADRSAQIHVFGGFASIYLNNIKVVEVKKEKEKKKTDSLNIEEASEGKERKEEETGDKGEREEESNKK